MLNHVILFSLKNRPLVLLAALGVVAFGIYQIQRIPVDVLPDLNRPTVTVMTEAPGLTPDVVEAQVTRAIEYQLNGATGVLRVRSSSGVGLSVVWVEFDWGTDIYRDRQIVAEKLQLAREKLPEGVNPIIAPISSIMGEIMLLGLRYESDAKSPAEQSDRAMELRTFGEFNVRNRLLGIEGVSQVTVMGGILKQYQVVTSPARLAAQNVTLDQLTEAAKKANVLAGGGVMVRSPKESLIRISGQSLKLKDIENTSVVWRDPRPVLIKDVADVRFGGPIRRGDGSVRIKNGDKITGGPAVILAVQKQPHADTLVLDRKITEALDQLEKELPSGAVIERHIFKQADFINAAVDNVTEAVRDGALWVIVVLFLFMWNFRVSISSLVAMPVSIILTFLVFQALGITINTLTLGGIAVAIGDLVDDSIVDIENIYRRLKENRQKANPENPLTVVYNASCEVRSSIVYATLIVALVVLPLFAMGGLEGRMFAPMGLAYITSLMASLLVSLTLTPVLGSYLLPNARFLEEKGDPFLLRGFKWVFERVLRVTLRHAYAVLGTVLVLVGVSVVSILWMDREFLPPFNEGTLTINLRTDPGTSLEESDRVARRAEDLLLPISEVMSVARRTGRAELDEHAEGVNSSEIDVRLLPHEQPLPGFGFAALRLVPIAHLWGYERVGRPREEVVGDIRDRLSVLPGVKVNIGQPISHRLDHILTGVRAQITVKVFGPDLKELRTAAQDVQTAMSKVPGVVDLQIEPQVEVPQVRLRIIPEEAARHGLTPGDVAHLLETAYKGRVVSQVLDKDRWFAMMVWYDESARSNPAVINQTILDTPSGRKVALGQVVEVLDTTGPNTLNRENVQLRMVVFCNVAADRGLGSVVTDIEKALVPIDEKLRAKGSGYRLELGGQFEAQRQAEIRLLVLGIAVFLGVFLLLTRCLESWRAALQVMVNIPLAALGAVIALLIAFAPSWDTLQATAWWQWPQVWIGGIKLSLAHWVGFITLIGIVSRNGIMMISHYIHLMKNEGEKFDEKMIIRGSLERLAPVMMTAFTSFIGLLPLLFGAGQTGKEILYPLSVVVFGGMLSSTLLDQLVTPALFFKFGKKVYENRPEEIGGGEAEGDGSVG
jgi:CzcA family heavy metal efflux pump